MHVVAPLLGFSVYQCYVSIISFINPVGRVLKESLEIDTQRVVVLKVYMSCPRYIGDTMEGCNDICANIKWVSVLLLKDVTSAVQYVIPLRIPRLNLDTHTTLVFALRSR